MQFQPFNLKLRNFVHFVLSRRRARASNSLPLKKREQDARARESESSAQHFVGMLHISVSVTLVIVSMFVLIDFVQGRFVVEIREGAYFCDEASYAEQNPWLQVPTNIILITRIMLTKF